MVNRVLKFTWDEWKWIAVIVMLGVVMYWTAVVVEPTYTLLQQSTETQQTIEMQADKAVEQNHMIIENQDNNTAKLEKIILKQRQLADNQLNLTRGLGNAAETITNQSNLIVLQSDDIKKIVNFFRSHFNESFLIGEQLERASTQNILDNVTQIGRQLFLQQHGINQTRLDEMIEKEMRKWIAEFKDNLTRQSLLP